LARIRELAGMRIEGLLLLGRRGISVHVGRHLLVEGLLFLLLRRVEGHGRWGLDTRDGDCLLRAGLMHSELTLPIFAECGFLG
jgi:hypothetical protein